MRLIRRLVAVLAAAALVAAGALWVRSASDPNSPARVGERIHADVLRDVVQRTGDYSMRIGKLDCTAFGPGRGSCLANATSDQHRADHLMVAVSYLVDSGGQVSWKVQLP